MLFIEAVTVDTGCNLLKRSVFWMTAFLVAFFIFFGNKFVERFFSGVSKCSSLRRYSFVNGRGGLPEI